MNSTLMSIGPSRARKRRHLGRARWRWPRRWRSPRRSPPRRKRPRRSPMAVSSIPSAAGSPSRPATFPRPFKGAGKEVEKFGDEAGAATPSTAPRAPPMPSRGFPARAWCRATRNARWRRNGAPDCVAAADAMCKTQGLRIRQEPRHDHRRGLPARRSICAGRTHRPGLHTPTPSSPARSANSACACRRAAAVFPLRQSPTGERG